MRRCWRWSDGKWVVLDIEEPGKKIGEKLFGMLSRTQQNDLRQYIFEKEGANPIFNVNLLVSNTEETPTAKKKYPLTEIREGNLYLCPELRLVTVRGQEVELTVKEFEILSILIMNPKRVFTYDMLIDLIWHEEYDYYSRKAVNNHVSNLRRKLKVTADEPDYIKSVYGVGYKFEI